MNKHVVESGPLAGMLHDLHLPASVSYWPLAPLWWVIALSVVALTSWLFVFLHRRNGLNLFGKSKNTETLTQTTQRHLQQYFSQWQQDDVATGYLEQANILLKRHVLSQQNTDNLPTAWHGLTWVKWMQEVTPSPLSQATKQSLAVDCYRPEETLTAIPIAEIHQQLLQWINDYDDQQHA